MGASFTMMNNWKYDDKVKLSIKALSTPGNGVFAEQGNFTLQNYAWATASRYVDISSTMSKYGNSVRIWQGTSRNGTSNNQRGYIRVSATGSNRYNLNPGSQSFTFETWVYPVRNSGDVETSAGGPVLHFHTDANNFFSIGFNRRGSQTYRFNINYLVAASYVWVGEYDTGVTTGYDSTWIHLAMTRTGSTWRFFINGALVTMSNILGGAPSTTIPYHNDLIIGSSLYSYIVDYNGCIDNWKWTVGRNDYTAAFTASYGTDYTKI